VVRVQEDLGRLFYGGGPFRTLRYPTRVRNIMGIDDLGTVIPRFNAKLFYKGKSIPIIAGVDTGATRIYVLVSPTAAEKLGLPKKAAGRVGVVGGGTAPAFESELDRVEIEDIPACAINKPKTIIATPISEVDVLIGEDYLKALGAKIEYTDKGPALSCRGGIPGIGLPEWGDWQYIAVGVGILFLFGFLVSLSSRE